MASTSWASKGIEAIVFRTSGDRPSSWESLLPEELAGVDALLDDPAFFSASSVLVSGLLT